MRGFFHPLHHTPRHPGWVLRADVGIRPYDFCIPVIRSIPPSRDPIPP